MKIIWFWGALVVIQTVAVSAHGVKVSFETFISFEPHDQAESLIDSFNRLKNQIRKIFDPFQSLIQSDNRTCKDHVAKIADVLRSYADEDLKNFTKNLHKSINVYVNKKLDVNYSFRSTIITIFKDLADVNPRVLKDKIDRFLRDDSSGVFNVLNVTCTKNDTDVLDKIIQEMINFPTKHQNFTDLVKSLDYFILNRYNNLNDSAKIQLQTTAKALLEYFGIYFYNDNDGLTLGRNDEEVLGKSVENSVKNSMEDVIDAITESLRNKATTKDLEVTKNDLEKEIIVNKNIEISVRSTQSDYIGELE